MFLLSDVIARKFYLRPLGLMMIPLWGLSFALLCLEEWRAAITSKEEFTWLGLGLVVLFFSVLADYFYFQKKLFGKSSQNKI